MKRQIPPDTVDYRLSCVEHRPPTHDVIVYGRTGVERVRRGYLESGVGKLPMDRVEDRVPDKLETGLWLQGRI